MKITWSVDTPLEVRRVVDPMFARWSFILPTWCHEVTGRYEVDGDPETTASCAAEPEYRRSAINIHGAFLQGDSTEREWAVRHELCHIPLGPLYSFVESLVDCIPELASRAVMQKQWEELVDGVVCDMARSFANGRPADR